MKYFEDFDNRKFFFLAFYCSFIWFVTRFALPLGGFQNIPIYLPLTIVCFAYLPARALFWSLGFTIFLLSYEMLKTVQPGVETSVRAMISATAVGMIVPSAGFSLLELLKYPEDRVLRWLRVTLYLYGFSQFIDIFVEASGLAPNTYIHYFVPFLHRYSGTLMEPSHLAPVLAPFLFIFVNFPRYFMEKMGRGGTLALGWIMFLGLSSTLFVVIIAALGFLLVRKALRFEIGGLVLVGGAAALLLVAFLAIPAFSARFFQAIVPTSTTELTVSEALSVLVLIKGFEMTAYAMAHFPLGVHVLDMQSLAPQSRISYISPFMYDANSNDGASVLFKGICEYGYLWIFFSLFAVVNLAVRFGRLASLHFVDLLKLGFLFAFLMTFVRGTSYFHNVAPFAIALTIFSLWDLICGILAVRVRDRWAY